MKKSALKILGIALVFLLCLSGCSTENTNETESTSGADTAVSVPSVDFDVKASSKKSVSKADTFITLKDSTAEIKGDGAYLDNTDILINKGGSYAVSGTLKNGRIVIKAGSGAVNVILNGVDITSDYSSAFLVKKASEVTLTAYEGSVNILRDAAEYNYYDDYSDSIEAEPDACVYSEENLTLNGEGRLLVQGNCKNGITSKTVLRVEKTNLSVSAKSHGVTGKEELIFTNATFNVSSGQDGIRANSTANFSVGTVMLVNSKGSISSGEDGIQAETTLTIESGDYSIISGGGSTAKADETLSTKAVKGGSAVQINGGTIKADSFDDSVHSNGSVNVVGGALTLNSGDDAIHADNDINISGGTILANNCYEGLEATNITVSGGVIKLSAIDDGINISGGDGSGEFNRPGMDFFSSTAGKFLVSSGRLIVNSEGDGLDANGSIEISGGTVIVNGPTRGGNGVLDYDGEFKISGGEFIAVGSSDMAQSPSESSTQNCLVYTDFSGNAKDIVGVLSADGSELITYTSPKSFNWFCYSSPKLKTGESYTAYVGGSHSGNSSDGVYSGGKYSLGTKIADIKAENIVSSNGSLNSWHPGGGRGPKGDKMRPDFMQR